MSSVALCVPAVRIVVVALFRIDERVQTIFYPVMAIRSIVAPDGSCRDGLLIHEEEPAYHEDGRQKTIVDAVDYLDDDEDAAVRWAAITCPWPSEEDPERLSPVVAQLRAQLDEHVEQLRDEFGYIPKFAP